MHLDDGSVLDYDVLVVAIGPDWSPRRPTGYGSGVDGDGVHLLRPPGRDRAGGGPRRFHGGRLVVNVVDMPIKCPVAPLEFCFLADWYFHERGIRDQIDDHLRDPARRCLHHTDRVERSRGHARRSSTSNW